MGERFNRWLASRLTSPLQGILHRDWRLMRTLPGARVDRGYRLRGLLTTLSSLANTRQARGERRRFGERIDAARPAPPVFILGHYRSGTTHLHNLFAVDERLGYPSYYQVTFPHTFLSTERRGVRMGSRLAMRKRPQDDVELGLTVPAEDELALCSGSVVSPHVAWHFPRAAVAHDRYLTLDDCTDDERARWNGFFDNFARALTVRYEGRPIVYKSPCHTARVRAILELFPDARFVHIHRDPFDVFRSTRHTEEKITPLFQFQARDLSTLDELILRRYRLMYDAYLADRGSIPSGRLVDVSYTGLVDDPLATLQRIYAEIDLGEFEPVRPRVERYLAGLSGYRPNRHIDLPDDVRRRIAREWEPAFDAWGYTSR